ncbi:hypothetical protein MMA231_02039 [Asticcacaulis sp. MM231]|uniref:polysaccharide deacetylase family protein n=1 Tax=Asticcacaulis sp. MM231 TaxID=3157666 RepID=UPI0032D57EA5
MLPYVNRRTVLGALGGGLAMASSPTNAKAKAPGIAITIDDFNLADTARLSGLQRDEAIRQALRRQKLKAAGFVAGKYIDADKSPQVLSAWSAEGHCLGNHSFSHSYFSGSDPDGEMADILKCESLLAPYAGFQKLFRFPFLAEGKTAEGRDRMRVLLRAHGYQNAPVTIDTSDWYIDQRMAGRLKLAPDSDIAPYRAYWLDHIWERATYYDGLAQKMLGRSIDHTLLLHHRLTTALFLDDGLRMFREKGWRLVDASTALARADLQIEYDTLPAGQSLLWAAAKASGRFESELRYPGEDSIYETARMDALGL